MNKDETKNIIAAMIASYPNFKPVDMAMTVNTWTTMLADYDYPIIAKALQKYIMSDKSGFAPSIGQVIALIDTKESGYREPLEAWSLVRKAICNANYHADEEFAKLPVECQVAIGSASNLKELAQMPSDTVESVEQSHFIRSYQGVVKRLDDERRLPKQYRSYTEQIAQKIQERKAIEVKEPVEEVTPDTVNTDRPPIAEIVKQKIEERRAQRAITQ